MKKLAKTEWTIGTPEYDARIDEEMRYADAVMSDPIDYEGMRQDVLAMTERAMREARERDEWKGHRSSVEAGKRFRFGLECRAFVDELAERGL